MLETLNESLNQVNQAACCEKSFLIQKPATNIAQIPSQVASQQLQSTNVMPQVNAIPTEELSRHAANDSASHCEANQSNMQSTSSLPVIHNDSQTQYTNVCEQYPTHEQPLIQLDNLPVEPTVIHQIQCDHMSGGQGLTEPCNIANCNTSHSMSYHTSHEPNS